MKKVIVAVTGASGANLGIKVASFLPKEYKKFVIISNTLKTKISPEPQGAVYLDPEKPETAENSLYFTELGYEL